jgi:hypothetical protein
MGNMRFVSVLALCATASALAGCAGGSTLDAVANLSAACATTDVSVNCGAPAKQVTPATQIVVVNPNTTNTGNTVTGLTSGDATIALEKSVLVSQKTNPAFSKLTIKTTPDSTAQIQIDTKSANNALWPIAKVLDEDVAGTAASGGLGLGSTSYKEYRVLSNSSAGTTQDEELQVWTWLYSSGTQYRDVTTGTGEALHQAWSFTGKSADGIVSGARTASAAMPTVGSADYTGQFGATAKTSNWVDSTNPAQTLSWNNIWSLTGVSQMHADFVTGAFTGTLTPQVWTARNRNDATMTDVLVSNPTDPNYIFYMKSIVNLKGQFTPGPTPDSRIVGTASENIADGWITNKDLNPMYAGFYDDVNKVGTARPAEVTGIFNLEATAPQPRGGTKPINNDGRGFIEMSGVFNGK